MRRWIRVAAALYPSAWRQRYGDEFQALIEDIDPGWTEFADVLLGALTMQISTSATYLKFAGATAIAGALVAMAVSYWTPREYVSEALVRMTPRESPTAAAPGKASQQGKEALDDAAAYQLSKLATEVLSRSSLAEIVMGPLNLYAEERAQLPIEDVLLRMRHDIRITPASGGGGQPLTAKVSFAYRDKEKAQAVVRWLVARLVVSNGNDDLIRARLWHQVWPDSDPVPAGEELLVLDPVSLPRPISPNRALFMAWGLGVGLVVGLGAASVMRRPKWTLQMAGFAVAGCAAAAALSFLLPDRYTSTTTLRFTRPLVPERLFPAVAELRTADTMREIEREVLSRDNLSRVIQKPSISLYREQLARVPLEEIVEKMRNRDLRIRMPGPAIGPGSAISISFSYPDRFKAAAVVREMVSQFVNRYLRAMNARSESAKDEDDIRIMHKYRIGPELEILDAPDVPQRPDGPDRLTYSAGGLALGLLAGSLTLRWRRHRNSDLQPA